MLVHIIHTLIRARTHTYTSVFRHEGTYTYARAHPRENTHVHAHDAYERAQTHMHPGTRGPDHACTHAPAHEHTCMRTHTYKHTHACMHAHAHALRTARRHMHAYTHTIHMHA